MRGILVLAAFAAVAVAVSPPYGVPNPPTELPGGHDNDPGNGYERKVFRHVYVHVAPDEPTIPQSRVIRVPGGDKHVNILFVKTPSSSSSQKTEVILPPQDEHKHIVYVILKKGQADSNIKIRRPPAAQPRKPEIHFIQYKDRDQNTGYPTQPPVYGTPKPNYGTQFY